MLELALTHRFGDFTLDVQISAGAGVTALFGKSGSGKTSIINAVAGLLQPDQGRIVLGGRVLFDRAQGINLPPHKRGVGYVFQDARLFPHLSVAGNLAYGARMRGRRVDAGPVVDMLGIGALLDRRPATLSGGEKQRVAIGRALLSDPQILLMDEPLAALDDGRKADILPYIERLRDGLGLPILYVSHALAEVARLASTVALVDQGRVRAVGPVAQVLADPDLAPALGLRDAGAVLQARLVAQEGDGLSRLMTAGGPLWLPQVAAELGGTLRVRIAAQDVILATQSPVGLSALNVLRGRVAHIRRGDGPGAIVQVDLGEGEMLLARITQRSVAALNLSVGSDVYAIAKSVAVAQADIGPR